MKKIVLLISTIFLISAFAVVFGGGEGESTTPPPSADDVVLRIGTTSILDAISPANGQEGYEFRYWFYDSLTEWTEITSFEPGLAESWTVSDDGLVWTFKVREGVTFHDGTPCAAEDMAWSLNFLMEGNIGMLAMYVEGFEEVVALDSTTLQITTDEPTAIMELGKLHFAWILPRSVWEGMTAEDAEEFEDVRALIGTGPYKVLEYKEDQHLIAVANENYFRGKPVIDRIVIQEYTEEALLVQALLSGEIDFARDVSFTAIDPLKSDPNIDVKVMDSTRIMNIVINSHENGTQPESLNDLAVREAMDYAFDKQKVINVALAGYGELPAAYLPPAYGEWVNPNIKPIPYDTDKGNRILDEAGYVDSDGDGIREYSDGSPLKYRFYGADRGSDAIIMEIMKEGCAEVGIKLELTLMDGDIIYDYMEPEWDYDLICSAWTFDPDPTFAVYTLSCSAIPDYLNDTGWCNEEYEEIYQKQKSSLNIDERRELIWKAQEMYRKYRPSLIYNNEKNIEAYRNDRFIFKDTSAGELLRKYFIIKDVVPVQ